MNAKDLESVVERARNSCPMCKNRDTHVEIRTWTKKNNEYITVEPYTARVCSHCKDKDGNGFAFIPSPKE